MLTAGMLALAVAFGGGGLDYPMLEASVEVGAIGLLWYVAVGREHSLSAPGVRAASAIAVSIIAIPILQLVPLPPAIWTHLPGRDLPNVILQLAGSGGWRPLSLDPGATLRSALSVLPGLAMFFAVIRLGRTDRLRLIYVLLAMASASAILGALQRGIPGAGFDLYDSGQSALASGLFVNSNHQATLLVVAIVMAAAAARANDHRRNAGPIRVMALIVIAVLFGGAIATTSRMGFTLLIIAVAAALLMLFPPRRSPARAAGLLVAFLLIAITILFSYGGMAVTARFAAFADERALYWRDAWVAIRDFWPVGSGLGTWIRVFPMVESVGVLGDTIVNNAHNDYVEVVLEAGAPAVLLILLLFGLLASALVRMRRSARAGHSTASAVAAWIAILLILLHSIVDYPLRMLSITATFGLLAGLLVTALHPARIENRRDFRAGE